MKSIDSSESVCGPGMGGLQRGVCAKALGDMGIDRLSNCGLCTENGSGRSYV